MKEVEDAIDSQQDKTKQPVSLRQMVLMTNCYEIDSDQNLFNKFNKMQAVTST